MLLGAPRRTLAVAAATAALGAISVAPAVQAAQQPNAEQQALLSDGLVDDLFGLVGVLGLQGALTFLGIDQPAEFGELLSTASPAQLDTLVTDLTDAQLAGGLDALVPADLAGVLTDSNPADLQEVLALATPADLAAALDTLPAGDIGGLLTGLDAAALDTLIGGIAPGELTGVLATLPSGDLLTLLDGADADTVTALVAGLSPETITGLLALEGGPDAVLGGLLGVAGGLSGADASAIDGLLAQVTALLGGNLPTDLAGLDSLLRTVDGLLATAGLDPAVLQGLYDQIADLLTQLPVAGPGATTVLGTLGGLLGITSSGGTSNPPGDTATPPAGTTTSPGGGNTAPPAARNLAYRALVKKIDVARNRRSVKVTVTCPAGTAGCIVALTGKAAKRSTGKARWFGLAAAATKTVKVKLSPKVARSLERKGGRISFTATTLYSTLGPKAKTVRIKKSRKARR